MRSIENESHRTGGTVRRAALSALGGFVLLLAGCGSAPEKTGSGRDYAAFNGNYHEDSERRGQPCRASVECNAATDLCRIKVERGAWGKDATGQVVEFKPGLLKISNEAELAGQTPTPEKAVVKQEGSVTYTGKGYLISVTNITRRAENQRGARARMKCESLVKSKAAK